MRRRGKTKRITVGRGRSQRADENVNTRSGNITRCREKINSKNFFSVDKLRQRGRNARVEGKNEGMRRRRARGDGDESGGTGGSVMLFSFPSAPEYCDSLTSRRNSFQ